MSDLKDKEMNDNRLWRPAAQRSVRNAWGYIQGQQAAWSTASLNARSAATNLVNAYLSQSDLGAMELGVLTDMDGIRDKARIKLQALQEKYLRQYLKSYDSLVKVVSEMRNISTSMRTYVKDSGGGPLIEFSKSPMISGDTGDGGGVAVFGALPLRIFEMLAKDLVSMFEKELRVKESAECAQWLLAAEFQDLVYECTDPANFKGHHRRLGYADPLTHTEGSGTDNKLDELDKASTIALDPLPKPPSREILQVYLTALLAEVHVNKDRISEVSRLWSEEMIGAITGSPLRK